MPSPGSTRCGRWPRACPAPHTSRRAATLLAFVRTLEASAQDDVLDLFDIVATALFADAAKVGKRARLRIIRDLDAAALQLRRAGGVLMDDTVEDGAVRQAAFAVVPRAAFAVALEQTDAIVRPPGDLYFTELPGSRSASTVLKPARPLESVKSSKVATAAA